MGPTNVALVKLYQTDQRYREAQGRLEAATKNVRVQDRRVRDLTEKLNVAQTKLRETQTHGAAMDLDMRSRDAKIEKLRNQQTNAKNNKEYQAFLIEINTEKVDRNKVEEEALKALQQAESLQNEIKEFNAHLATEQAKATTMKGEVVARVAELQGEIDAIKPEVDAARAAVLPRALEAFDRLADRFDGEAMASLAKPDRRREEYICNACNMSLVVDVYNRLHARDELVFCPSCRKILYIPEELPIETAVHKVKERREPRGKAPPAAVGRQTSASDVLRSISVEEEETPPADEGNAQPQ